MRRPARCGIVVHTALLLAACVDGEQAASVGDSAADAWLVPYAAAAAGPGWPATDVEVGARIFQQDHRLRRFVPVCRDTPAEVLPDSIGPLRVGQTLSEVLAACAGVLRGWEWNDDGRFAPALAATVGGAIVVAMLTDTLPQGVVGYLSTGDAGTPEGFGAGSPIEDLLAELGSLTLHAGTCSIEMRFAARPGLSFLLELPPGEGLDCGELSAIARDSALDRLPPGTAVRLIVLQRVGGSG